MVCKSCGKEVRSTLTDQCPACGAEDYGRGEIKVKAFPSVIELRPSWWRHPILRWKLRHLLPDMEAFVDDELRKRLNRRLDEAFLLGTDKK